VLTFAARIVIWETGEWRLANRIVSVILLLLLGSTGSSQAQTEMSIGVLAFRGEEDALERWSPTADYLSTKIPDYRFEILPLSLEGISRQVEQGRLDFILTNTGNYVVLEHAFGITRLATLKLQYQQQEFTQFGAVIFTRRDNDELNSIADIAGHSMMAVSKNAFGGFQMAWREMVDTGVDPFTDLGKIRFIGFPQDEIVHSVVERRVDVGTVRSGTLERMAADGLIDIDSIKVLGARESDGFPFLHSTRLYPEWAFAKARDTPQLLAQKVAVALLQLRPEHEAAQKAYVSGWTIPLDYGPVHELFRELEIGPYEYLSKPSLDSVWREYKLWIVSSLVMLLALVALIALLGRANRRISLSEARYREEANQRRQVQESLAAHKDNLEQRVAERTAELAEVNSSLRRSEATLRAIHDITSDPESDFKTRLQGLLQEGCRFFEMEFAAVANGVGDRFELDSRAGKHGALQESLAVCIIEELQGMRETLSVSDFSSHSWRGQRDNSALESGSGVGTTYLVEGKPSGCILFCDSSSARREFSDVDIDILELMAQWLGGEIERAKIQSRAQEHQAQLAHVARLSTMGEMATGIAHELNQPLTAILNYSNGCLRLLQKNRNDDDSLHSAISNIGSDAKRAADIIKRLREFIRHGELQQDNFSIREPIEAALEILQQRLLQAQISVDVDCVENIPGVQADRIQIEQVVVNLLLNAIDALSDFPLEKRRILIKVIETGTGKLEVAVSNCGAALPVDVVAHLFDPFFTTKDDGMGMGLSISRSIVEAHGGTIEYLVDARAQPTFRFTLPMD